jgi:hypothetical protein
VDEFEVEYAPYQAEPPPQDAQEADGLEEAQNKGVAVVTGVAAEAAVDEASPTIENGGEDTTKALDDSNWLDETPTAPEPPTAPNY